MSTPSPTSTECTEPEHRKNSWNDLIASSFSNLKTLWPDESSHPAQVAIRTYSLSLFLFLGPALLPVAVDLITRSSSLENSSSRLRRVLKRELDFTGFPFAITVAVGGGVAFKHFWEAVHIHHNDVQDGRDVEQQSAVTSTFRRHAALSIARVCSLIPNSTPSQKTFLSNVLSSAIALFLLQRIRQSKSASHRPSPTFEITLLFAFRAADAIIQHFLRMVAARKARMFNLSATNSRELAVDGDHEAKEWYQNTAAWLDAVMFWASSARCVT